MSLDPEIKATMDAQCRGVAGRAMVSIVSDSFESNTGLLLESGQKGTPRPNHVRGYFTGDSEGVKRPTFATSGSRNSGKIDLSGAETQAMDQTMTKASGDDDGVRRVERWPEAEAGENKKEGKENLVEETTFDLTLRSHGHIRVETLLMD